MSSSQKYQKLCDVAALMSTKMLYLTIFSMLGLWIKNGTDILYSQETHITFWCPMRFGKYPLDHQVYQSFLNSTTRLQQPWRLRQNYYFWNFKLCHILGSREWSLLFTGANKANISDRQYRDTTTALKMYSCNLKDQIYFRGFFQIL